jgi:hypothetical protein
MTGLWRIVEHRVVRFNSSLNRLPSDAPFTLKTHRIIPTVVANVDGVVVYQVEYRLTATDRKDRDLWHCDVTIAYVYRHDPAPVPQETLDAHLPDVYRYGHDVLREFLHNITGWMGLPGPLVLEVYRPSPEPAQT